MEPNPEIRASDADRDRVADMLREHCAQGRITLDELQERLEVTYAARTIGALRAVTADLPEEDLYELPVPARVRASVARPQSGTGVVSPGALRVAWGSWATVNLICVTIWLITVLSGGPAFPWWIWVAGPWGAVILAGQLFGPRGPGRPGDSRRL